ncbi:hypothetical protein ACF06L_15595 [Streptomyces sp. NPDC015408]|uniref:hypothetical protein n=1 Tax=Streptomyces sp. NPDC015408 TaxID=3364956 RepID=UPI003701EC26
MRLAVRSKEVVDDKDLRTHRNPLPSPTPSMLDVGSGAMATYGHDAFDTASVVKVDILATLLLQAQDQGRRLSTEERAQSAAMTQKSDNDSTSALWTRTGSAPGLDTANARLALLQTRGGQGPSGASPRPRQKIRYACSSPCSATSRP